MKKKIIGIFVCMLMVNSVVAIANNAENDKIDQDISEISLKIPIGEYIIEETDQGDEIYVEDFGHLFIPGKPNLPSKIFSIAIPPGAIFKDITYDSGEGITIPGEYEVEPINLPRVIGQEDPEVYLQELNKYNENYETVYGSDDSYPTSQVEFERTAGYRKYNIVDVRINPFTYQPVSKKLTLYHDITVTISYTYTQDFSVDDIMIDNIERTEQLAEEIILNYNKAKDWYPFSTVSRENYDYVIITLESLESSITSLVDWEEAKGKSVYIATTSWIDDNYDGYDLAEKIRNFLRDKYPEEEWGILDVCLIGSYDDVPMRKTAQSVGYGAPDTDYYYAELSLPDDESWDADQDHQYGEDSDPIDFHAEVNVGRIPWSDPETVEHICEKSVAYEGTDDPTFKKNILLIGTFFWPDTDNAVLMELKVDQEWMEDWNMTRMYEEEQCVYECDYDVSYETVKEIWSEGTYAFVNWAGHGSPTACYEYYPQQPFVDTQTCNYLNDDYPAIIFACACSNSDTDEDNIGQMMMEQGGIGFLGATKVAYGFHGWDDPYDGASASMDYFFTTCCTSGNYTQGQAHQYALLEMYTNDLWYYPYYETFEWGALWGNPDLTMAPVYISEPPKIPDAPSPSWLEEGVPLETYPFTASTTDPEGDKLFYMWDWGDGNITDWIGPYDSGETVSASHTWDEIGNYEIKIRAKDEYNTKSDWSEASVFPIVENPPPSIPTIVGPDSGKKGETYEFKVVSTDPHEQDIRYMIIWGNAGSGYTKELYPSGEEVTFKHKWNLKGEFTIKVKAKDRTGAESDWGYLKITMPIYKPIVLNLLDWLLERFPNVFPILRQILCV